VKTIKPFTEVCVSVCVPDGVMIELEQVGKFIQKNCTWLCNDDLLDSHLVEEIKK